MTNLPVVCCAMQTSPLGKGEVEFYARAAARGMGLIPSAFITVQLPEKRSALQGSPCAFYAQFLERRRNFEFIVFICFGSQHLPRALALSP